MKWLRVFLATRLSARGLAREIAVRFLILASPEGRGGFERCSKKKKGVVPFEGHPRLSLVFRIRLPRHCASTRELNSRDTGFLSSVLLRRTFHHPPHPDVRPGRRSFPAALPDTCFRGEARSSGLGRPLSACRPLLAEARVRTSPVTPIQRCARFPGVPSGTFRSWPPQFGLRSGCGLQLLSSRLEFRFVRPPPFLVPLPAWPFASPVSRLRSWPGPCRGRWAWPPCPLTGVLPSGFRWLNETISPNAS